MNAINLLLNMPLFARLAIVFALGCAAGAIVNWAIYSLAWNRRPFSPWSSPPDGASHRSCADRVPIWGWWRLRREAKIFGPRFWIRPLFIELGLGLGLAALYWWEVERGSLVVGQLAMILGAPNPKRFVDVPHSILFPTFASHFVLIALMAAASFIDIDEKLIPDGVTVVGTLLGLTIATLLPMSLLPSINIVPPQAVDAVSVPLESPNGGPIAIQSDPLVISRVTIAAPDAWPMQLVGAPNWRSLALGVACYWLWCFALIERIWRGRRGFRFAIRLIAARLVKECQHLPMLCIAPAGTLAILTVWWLGGAAWIGLLTALVGLVGGGCVVWAVRIIGTAALRREAMGFGDVTLMMMIGTFLGWQACLILFFLAPFAGLVVGVFQWVARSDDVIPYGPFLCLAAIGVILQWSAIWNWGRGIFEIGWLVPAVLAVCLVAMGAMLWVWQRIKETLFGLSHAVED